MSSPVLTAGASGRQLILQLHEGLLVHRTVRDVVAQGVYQRGLKAMAADLDETPGNLSVQLSDSTERKFSTDQMETYIQRTGDKSPIYYLVARYLGDEGAARDQALGQVASLLQDLPALLAAAGLPTSIKAPLARGRR